MQGHNDVGTYVHATHVANSILEIAQTVALSRRSAKIALPKQCALVNIILEGKVRIIGIKTKKNSKRSFRVYCLIERCLDYQISSATIIERYSDKSVLH